jgi:hypothetical protein
MSFHESACDVHLSPGREPGTTFLVAICNNEEGSGLTSNILLDDFLGNDNGKVYVSLSIRFLAHGNHIPTRAFHLGRKKRDSVLSESTAMQGRTISTAHTSCQPSKSIE